MEAGINISSFFAGVSTAFFAMLAFYILVFQKAKHRTRFQSVLGWIFVTWALWNLKDIVITFPQLYTRRVLNYIMFVDGWEAITYTIFIFEAVMPRWTTWRRVMLLLVPFLLFTAAYVVWPLDEIATAYMVFLWFYAWTVVIIAFFKVRRYIRYIRANYSNIDEIDVSWMRQVFLFCIVSQLLWLFTSVQGNAWCDVVYYLSTIILWTILLYYGYSLRPIAVDNSQESLADNPPKDYSFAGQLEQITEEQQLYLNKNLTLADLAKAVGTNRTYVSNYLMQVKHQTFYDYINDLRLQRMALPMMDQHPEFTIEHIAQESGFNSISTFRRAFTKLVGISPSQYRQA